MSAAESYPNAASYASDPSPWNGTLAVELSDMLGQLDKWHQHSIWLNSILYAYCCRHGLLQPPDPWYGDPSELVSDVARFIQEEGP